MRITRKQAETLSAFNRNGSIQRYYGSWWHLSTLVERKLITVRMLASREFDVQVTDAGRAFLKAQA